MAAPQTPMILNVHPDSASGPIVPIVRSVIRRSSWMVAVLLAAWIAWTVQPLTVDNVFAYTSALQFSYADVYNELHEQPFAYCDSYYQQREEALTRIRAQTKELS